MQSRTTAATSPSLSGWITTKGYSTRQSVASVTWDTRASPSNWILSLRVLRLSFFSARRRNAATSAKPAPKASTASRARSIRNVTFCARAACCA